RLGSDPEGEVLVQQAGQQSCRGVLVLPAVVDRVLVDNAEGDGALVVRGTELLARGFEAVDLPRERPGQGQRVDEPGPAGVLPGPSPPEERFAPADLLDLYATL